MRQFFIFVILLASLPGSILGLESEVEIPPEASECARGNLPNWKTTMQREAAVFELAGMEDLIPSAELRSGYIVFSLYRSAIKRFVQSDILDPRGFAKPLEYVFPLYADSVYLGGLRVSQLSKDIPRTSQKAGDWVLSGVETRLGLSGCYQREALFAAENRRLDIVRFRVAGGGSYIVVPRGEEVFFVPTSEVDEGTSTPMTIEKLRMIAVSLRGMATLKARLRDLH